MRLHAPPRPRAPTLPSRPTPLRRAAPSRRLSRPLPPSRAAQDDGSSAPASTFNCPIYLNTFPLEAAKRRVFYDDAAAAVAAALDAGETRLRVVS